MLYALDIDGTLIRSFMRDTKCERCHGERRVLAAALAEGVTPTDGDYVSCPGCVANYDHVELLTGRAGTLWRLAQEPHTRFALITNQAGVAFGYQTKSQVGQKLARVTLACDFFYGCPYSVHVAFGHPSAIVAPYREPEQVERRKPAPLMLLEAMNRHATSAGQTIYVGDMDSDLECALAAGVTYVDARTFFRDPLGVVV